MQSREPEYLRTEYIRMLAVVVDKCKDSDALWKKIKLVCMVIFDFYWLL